MNTITKAVIKSRAAIPSTKDLEKLRRDAPGLFDSGYFVLAAIDGAPPSARDAATFVVNAENGGFAGRITVVPKQPASTAAAITLRDRLSDATAAFAERTHAQAAVGGTGANLIDYRELGMDRLPVVIAALSLLSLFMLIAITRSFLTALAAVLLNLLTAGVAFGALSMLFSGDAPALGGPGFVDPVTMISIVTVILALGVQYEIYALERLRLITGAGIAMIAALLPFAGANLILVRQFAIGMAIAIAVDSLVVRRLVIAVKERKRRLHVHTGGPRFVHH
jgi:uncharacterized membrane protein YdfJ with MMPL/SSD domain